MVSKEGVGWEVEAIGILKTSKKIEAAKKLMDWHISPAAMAMMIAYTCAGARILHGLLTRGITLRTQAWRTR